MPDGYTDFTMVGLGPLALRVRKNCGLGLILECVNLPIMAILQQLSFWACVHQIVCFSLPVCCSKYDRCALTAIQHSCYIAATTRLVSIILTIAWVATREPATALGLAPNCWWSGDGIGTGDDYWECYKDSNHCKASCADIASNETRVWWSRKGFIDPAGREEDLGERSKSRAAFEGFASEANANDFYKDRWSDAMAGATAACVVAILINFSMIWFNAHVGRMATEALAGQRAAPVGVHVAPVGPVHAAPVVARGQPVAAATIPMAQVEMAPLARGSTVQGTVIEVEATPIEPGEQVY